VHHRCWSAGCRLRIAHKTGRLWLLCSCDKAIGRLDQLAIQTGYRVDALAAFLGVTSRCLQMVFMRDLEISPKHWLEDLRMVEARRMLCSGLPRAEAARCLGFSHPQHFTREFLRAHGVTPGTFVANARRARSL